MSEKLKELVYHIFFPKFSKNEIEGIIVDLTKNNFEKLIKKYNSDSFPGDHLVFYMTSPVGEYITEGKTIFFYIWDYEEIGPHGYIVGKGNIKEILQLKIEQPNAWEENDEKRTSFDNKDEMMKYCVKQIIKIKFSDLEYTSNHDNYFTFQMMISHLFKIDNANDNWELLLKIFSPDDIGHFYLSKEQVEVINSKLQSRPPNEQVEKKDNGQMVINDIFLIAKNGSLISHNSRQLRPNVDDEILSSMFTAIQGFIKTLLGSDDDEVLTEFIFGNQKILIEHGKYVFVASVITGESNADLRENMKRAIFNIEFESGSVLDGWSGDNKELSGAKKWIGKLIIGQSIEKIN